MRLIIVLGLLLLITGCATDTYEPTLDQGVVCKKMVVDPDKKDSQLCIPVQYNYDPVRFHYLPNWQRDRFPSMPSPN